MWLKDMFGTNKPIIGMMHLHAMPTDPKYDPEEGVEGVLEAARADLKALQGAGFDSVLFCNEFSIPYTRDVHPVTLATMARIIGELKSEIELPFGVNVAADACKTFDLAAATGAAFVRETVHGAHAGVYGITDIDPGAVERHRVDVGCKDVRTMTAIIPEGERAIAELPIEKVVKTLVFNVNPDVLLVFSEHAGAAIDEELVRQIKGCTDTPVFASNGVKASTVAEILSVADGAIVGTSVKVDGSFYKPVDPVRARELMDAARLARGSA